MRIAHWLSRVLLWMNRSLPKDEPPRPADFADGGRETVTSPPVEIPPTNPWTFPHSR